MQLEIYELESCCLRFLSICEPESLFVRSDLFCDFLCFPDGVFGCFREPLRDYLDFDPEYCLLLDFEAE